MSIDRKEWDFGLYYYLQLADTVKYILKYILIYIIKEQYTDNGKNQQKLKKCCQDNVNDKWCQNKWLHIADVPLAKWASPECQQFNVLQIRLLNLIWSWVYIIEVLATFIVTGVFISQ